MKNEQVHPVLNMFGLLYLAITYLYVSTAHACPLRCDCKVVDSEMVVYCRHQRLTSIPRDIPLDTVKLIFGFNSITELNSSAAFPPLPRLRELYLDNCQLTLLAERAFVALPELQVLQLHNNRIVIIHSGAFRGLSRLAKLTLSKNNITRLPDFLFAGVALDQLSLDENQIENLPANLFRDASIVELDLDQNSVGSLSVETFYPLRESLKRFTLSHNRRPLALEAGVFEGFLLDELTLSHDQITDTAFIQTLIVKALDLSGNPLSSFSLQFDKLDNLAYVQHVRLRDVGVDRIRPELFANLRELRSLDLTGNRISIVDGELFRRTPDIVTLNLTDNRLVSLPTRMGRTLKNLKKLDLSSNRITTVLSEDLVGLSQLRILDLRFNRLQVLPESVRDIFSSIPELYLHDNPLHCNCQMRWFRQWMDTYRSFTGAEDCYSPTPDGRDSYIWSWHADDFVCTSPLITHVSPNTRVSQGDRLLITCEARADPAPHVTWAVPSGDIVRTPAPSDRAQYVTHATYLIASASASDGGNYTCTARNLMGAVSRTIRINVTSAQTTYSLAHEISGYTTGALAVSQSYQSPMTMAYQWMTTTTTTTTGQQKNPTTSSTTLTTANQDKSLSSVDPTAKKIQEETTTTFKRRTMILISVGLCFIAAIAVILLIAGCIPAFE